MYNRTVKIVAHAAVITEDWRTEAEGKGTSI